jgi:hypothetical protein
MKWSTPVLLLIFVMYLLFFPKELRPELGLRPAWTVEVAAAAVSDAPRVHSITPIPFTVDKLFGYVSNEGELLLREEKLFGLAIDSTRYVSFANVSESLQLHDNLGRLTDNMEVVGYPMLLDERLLLISTNRSEIAELIDGSGPSWKREYTTIITDIDARGGLIALGLLDSRVQILGEGGEVVLDFDLKGSRINAVYGCVLSDDASKLAVIHGIDPQYVTIIDMMSGTVEIENYRLDTEYRTTRYLRFFESDHYLVIEGDGVLKILDLEKNTEFQVEIPGSFVDAGVLENDNLIWVIAGGDGDAGLLIVDPPGRVLFKTDIASGANVRSVGDNLMLGINGSLCMAQKEQR